MLTRAGGDGRYRIDGLRAGRYLAVALLPGTGSLTGLTREYFDLVTRHATPVVVHDGEAVMLHLPLSDLQR